MAIWLPFFNARLTLSAGLFLGTANALRHGGPLGMCRAAPVRSGLTNLRRSAARIRSDGLHHLLRHVRCGGEAESELTRAGSLLERWSRTFHFPEDTSPSLAVSSTPPLALR